MRHGLLFECAECAEKKRGKCLFPKHLPRILLIFNIFRLFLDGSLRGSETGYGHAEGRAAGVVHANLGAELH